MFFYKTVAVFELAVAHLEHDIAHQLTVGFPGNVVPRVDAPVVDHIRVPNKGLHRLYRLAQARRLLEPKLGSRHLHLAFEVL